MIQVGRIAPLLSAAVSSRARLLLQALVTVLAVAAIGGSLWWATSDPDPVSSQATLAAEVPEAAATVPPATVPPATAAVPTEPPATPTVPPTPTPIPEPVAFTDVIGRPDLVEVVTSPLPECALIPTGEVVAGTIAMRCLDELATASVHPIAAGRIVHISTQPAPEAALVPRLSNALTGGPGVWSWTEQATLGPHVVVDHGAIDGAPSRQSVYAGLDTIDPALVIGLPVEITTQLGSVDGPFPELRVSLWDTNMRQDGAIAVLEAPDLEAQRAAAAAISELIVSPTDPQCPLNLGFGQLPGASRLYRNGTHQGIDFGCGTSDRFGHAIADGRVVYLVNDYVDPSVADREALLRNAAFAGFTPHWTLVMLYGNVVVIDHGEIPGVGRMYSIAAHLEQVDAGITLDGTVTQGQLIGEFGNRGTNAAAQGLRGAQDPSLHLHWELFIDNWYLGSGQRAGLVTELITTALCGPAQTPGCPV